MRSISSSSADTDQQLSLQRHAATIAGLVLTGAGLAAGAWVVSSVLKLIDDPRAAALVRMFADLSAAERSLDAGVYGSMEMPPGLGLLLGVVLYIFLISVVGRLALKAISAGVGLIQLHARELLGQLKNAHQGGRGAVR